MKDMPVIVWNENEKEKLKVWGRWGKVRGENK